MGSKTINIILGILAVVVLIFVFFYFSGSGTTAPTGLTAEVTTGVSSIDVFLKQISAIRDIPLDGAVFNNPVLKNLVDKSKAITPENKGKDNPFAPLTRRSASQAVVPTTITAPATITAPVVIPVTTPTPLAD